MIVADLVASVVQDFHVKLRAEDEVAKRMRSSAASMACLHRDANLTYAEIEQMVRDGLLAKGWGEDRVKKAGASRERIKQLIARS